MTTRHNKGISKEHEPIKCVTEECENLTAMVVCEDCVDALFDTYEHRLEREKGL